MIFHKLMSYSLNIDQRMAKIASKKKDRGKFLTVLFFSNGFFLVLSIPSYFAGQTILRSMGVTFTPPLWIVGYSVITLILDVAALYGIWKWKKWGVVLWFVLMGLSILTSPHLVTQALSSLPNNLRQDTSLNDYIRPIVGLALWLWAIYRKWKYFE